jgi:hypothetical protein
MSPRESPLQLKNIFLPQIPYLNLYTRLRKPKKPFNIKWLNSASVSIGGVDPILKGIYREDLEGVDGYFAVLLWDDFRRKGNQKALNTLLAYNTLDVVNLETLMVAAYDGKLTDTPFLLTHQLPIPSSPENPFKADKETIERIKRNSYGYSRWY